MKDETRIVHGGTDLDFEIRIVNPPVYRASTVLYPTVESLKDHNRTYTYGRHGTPTTRALETALAALEGGEKTVLLPSGLAAITCALLSVLKAGDHLLVTDAVYAPNRRFCDRFLSRMGVSVSYYDPMIGAGIDALFQPNTRAVFVEAPSSLTFEVQDLPAIAAAAHKNGALVLVDNTWASPLYFKPLAHGADISIQAATKYVCGHSDIMLGTITASGEVASAVHDTHGLTGHHVSPDDVYMGLRGLRTLGVRMPRHYENGLAVARWLQGRKEVERVLHPALEGSAGHAIWKRDFLGASGTFGAILKPVPKKAIAAMLEHLTLFSLGYSFGGYESLILLTDPRPQRSVTQWTDAPTLRLHVGLEDAGDLIADLDAGFARMAQEAGA